MVGKTYLRYVVGPQGGSVVSRASLTIDATLGRPQYNTARVAGRQQSPQSRMAVQSSAMLFLPSLEAVRVYSVKSGTLLHTLIPAEAKMPLEVTALRVFALEPTSSRTPYAAGPTNTSGDDSPVASSSAQDKGWLLLAGYSNGFVAVFACGPGNNYGAPLCRFYAMGHKTDTAVLALDVDAARALACSAGQDTDVTVWDMISQEASFRLRGHRGGVVGLQFVPGNDARLISAAADGLVKVWDVTLRQCVQTLVASDTQVTAMVMDVGGRRLYCGMRENYIKVYNVEGLQQQQQQQGNSSSRAIEDKSLVTDTVTDGGAVGGLVEHGTLSRKYHKPITSLRFSPDGSFLVACTSKTVEVFHVLTASEVRRKVMRKRRRRRAADGKKANGEEDDSEGDDGGEEREDDGGKRLKATARKKARRTAGEQEGEADTTTVNAAEANHTKDTTATSMAVGPTATEEVVLLRTFFLDDKVRGACVLPRATRNTGGGGGGAAAEQLPGTELYLAVSFANNTVHTYSTQLVLSELEGAATWSLADLQLRYSFDEHGHQSDIRRLCFVDQDSMLLSMSAEKVMLWSLAVAHEMLDCDHVNASDFHDAHEANLVRPEFKGTLHAVGAVPVSEATSMAAISSGLCCVGQANGGVVLLDVASAQTLCSEPGVHMGGVKDVVLRNDKSGFLSLGADRRLLLWTVGLVAAEGGKATQSKSATLLQSHEVELAETPLFAAFSPDNRFLGVGLHSHTIQLFFADSLKPYLSLFGHKLPPTAMDFSSDGSLAVSVGMDKSLRFWGTDFGDCHRAIHAHDDYITDVHFQRDTHYVFTVSLDGALKQWDGDNWTMVQLFRQHAHGLWASAITVNGTCVATAGADRCIRCFLRTSDIVFPQEEEERMAQEAMDEESARRVAQQRLEAVAVDAGAAAEVGLAAQPTAATAEAAERLMEALDLVSVELQRRQNPDDPNRHPLLLRCTEWEYLWSVIESIRPSELRHALGALTSVHVDALLNYLVEMLKAGAVLNYEVAAKVVLALFVPSPSAAGGGGTGYALHASLAALSGAESEAQGLRRLEQLRRGIAEGLDRAMSQMDYSVAGLQVVRQYMQDTEHVKFFDLSAIQGYKKRYHSRALLPSESKGHVDAA